MDQIENCKIIEFIYLQIKTTFKIEVLKTVPAENDGIPNLIANDK